MTEQDRTTREDPRAALTSLQIRVLSDLGRGRGVVEVAARAGVHPVRVRRWLSTPTFQRALLREREKPLSLAERLKLLASEGRTR